MHTPTRSAQHRGAGCNIPPNAVTPDSIAIAIPRASSTILPVVYAMLESHRGREAEHQAGRTWGGLCHGGGSGDCAPAPAGPPEVLDPSSQHMPPPFFTSAPG
jgi:hypothetical protein